jgi:hypothetical protein
MANEVDEELRRLHQARRGTVADNAMPFVDKLFEGVFGKYKKEKDQGEAEREAVEKKRKDEDED